MEIRELRRKQLPELCQTWMRPGQPKSGAYYLCNDTDTPERKDIHHSSSIYFYLLCAKNHVGSRDIKSVRAVCNLRGPVG